jgi:hypothetical protein
MKLRPGSDCIWVGTRKGLFALQRASGGAPRWSVSTPHFLGDPVTTVLEDERDGMLYAALNLGHFGVKLRRSADRGASWTELAAPQYPKANSQENAPALELLWCLESAGADLPGSLWAGTIPGGLFRSDNRGDSWTLVQSLWDRPEREEWTGGGYDHAGIDSICVHPRDSRCVTVAISTGGVWKTMDGGASWTLSAQGMRAAYLPPEAAHNPNQQDVHRMVQCRSNPDVLWVQHHNGVFHSSDGAASWREITNVAPSVFGFAAAVHPDNPDVAWFVPAIKDEKRVPVDARLVVSRTRDGGRSFEVLRRGLPQVPSYDLVYRHGLDVDSTGRRLVMGSTTGGVWISEDDGDSWLEVEARLPPVYCVRFGSA